MVAPAPAKTRGRTLLGNSTLAFVVAAMVNDTLHELAHLAAALSQHLAATLTPFSVDYGSAGTTAQQVLIAAAGPVFSLVMGLVLMRLSRSWGQGLVRLFLLWLSFMGVMNFVGYLVIAPFAQVGDTGRVLSLLHAPGLVYVAVALVGAAGQFWLGYAFARSVRRYSSNLTDERQLAFHAWIIGTLVVMVLTVLEVVALGAEPAVVFVVVFYSFAIGIFAPMQFLFHQRFPALGERLRLRSVNGVGVALTALLAVALIALAAAGGVQVG